MSFQQAAASSASAAPQPEEEAACRRLPHLHGLFCVMHAAASCTDMFIMIYAKYVPKMLKMSHFMRARASMLRGVRGTLHKEAPCRWVGRRETGRSTLSMFTCLFECSENSKNFFMSLKKGSAKVQMQEWSQIPGKMGKVVAGGRVAGAVAYRSRYGRSSC